MNLPLKYHPDRFGKIAGQAFAKKQVKLTIAEIRDGQACQNGILFVGPPGTGKTSTAKIFPYAVHCRRFSSEQDICGICDVCVNMRQMPSAYYREINCADTDERDILETLNDLRYHSVTRTPIMVFDEIGNLSPKMQGLITARIEAQTQDSISDQMLQAVTTSPQIRQQPFFLFATTPDKLKKVDPSLQNRLKSIEFLPLTHEEIVGHLAYIVKKENLNYEVDALSSIELQAGGSVRMAVSKLNEVVRAAGIVTAQSVMKTLGQPAEAEFVSILHRLKDSLAYFDSTVIDLLHRAYPQVFVRSFTQALLRVYERSLNLKQTGALSTELDTAQLAVLNRIPTATLITCVACVKSRSFQEAGTVNQIRLHLLNLFHRISAPEESQSFQSRIDIRMSVRRKRKITIGKYLS